MTVVRLRLNNREPSLFDTIRSLGVPVDLTGATVKLQARSESSATLVIDTAASLLAGATTLSANTTLPEPAITVASTTGFAPNGALNVGTQIVEYDEISGNTFLGCRGGEGTISSGAAVTQRGGVRYDWALADVDAEIELVGWWEVTFSGGKVQETPSFQIVVEDPTVISQGLCEIADVLAYAPGYRSDAQTDRLLEQMILAKTREFAQQSGREVKPITPAVATRRFDLESWHVNARKVYVGDLASSPSSVKVIDSDQTTELATVASTDYVLWPRVRGPWEPINALVFPPSSPNAPTLAVGYVLEVTGTWGFPTVPADLREACASLVVVEYAANPALIGTALAEALAEVNLGALFAGARRVFESYAFPNVA